MYVVGLVQFSRELCKQQGSMAGLLISGVWWYTHPVPQFRAVYSETFIADIGYTGHLFMNECVLPATIEVQKDHKFNDGDGGEPRQRSGCGSSSSSTAPTVLLASIPMIFSLPVSYAGHTETGTAFPRSCWASWPTVYIRNNIRSHLEARQRGTAL